MRRFSRKWVWLLGICMVLAVPTFLIAQDIIEWPGVTLFFRGFNPNIKFDGVLSFLNKTPGVTASVALAPGGSGTCQLSPPSALASNTRGAATAACPVTGVTPYSKVLMTVATLNSVDEAGFNVGPIASGLELDYVVPLSGYLSVYFKCLSGATCPTNPNSKTFAYFTFL